MSRRTPKPKSLDDAVKALTSARKERRVQLRQGGGGNSGAALEALTAQELAAIEAAGKPNQCFAAYPSGARCIRTAPWRGRMCAKCLRRGAGVWRPKGAPDAR